MELIEYQDKIEGGRTPMPAGVRTIPDAVTVHRCKLVAKLDAQQARQDAEREVKVAKKEKKDGKKSKKERKRYVFLFLLRTSVVAHDLGADRHGERSAESRSVVISHRLFPKQEFKPCDPCFPNVK